MIASSEKVARAIGLTLLLSLVTLAGFIYLTGSASPTVVDAAALPSVRIAAYTGEVGMLPFVAEDFGFFKEEKLKVEIIPFHTGALSTQALLQKKADMAMGSELVIAHSLLSHPELRIVAKMCNGRKNRLIVRKTRDVQTLKDLRGRRIGVPLQSGAHYFLDQILKEQALDIKDVTIVNVLPRNAYEELMSGRMDAIAYWEPYISALEEKLGAHAFSHTTLTAQPYFFYLLSTDAYLSEHQEEVQRLLRGIVVAEHFVKQQPMEAKEYAARRFKIDRRILDASWSDIDFDVSLPQAILAPLEDVVSWQIELSQNQAAELPNMLNFIAFPPLEQIAPERVTIVH